jgi:hypothetical protein
MKAGIRDSAFGIRKSEPLTPDRGLRFTIPDPESRIPTFPRIATFPR